MSIIKYSPEDTDRLAEKLWQLEQDIKSLKMASKVRYSDSNYVVTSGTFYDKNTFVFTVPENTLWVWQLEFQGIYKDWAGNTYSYHEKSAVPTAESTYFQWGVIGVRKGGYSFLDYELNWVAGNKRQYRITRSFGAGSYSRYGYCRIVQENATPQRRSAPCWGTYRAFQVALQQ